MGEGMTELFVALFSIVLSPTRTVSKSRAVHNPVVASSDAIKVVPFIVGRGRVCAQCRPSFALKCTRSRTLRHASKPAVDLNDNTNNECYREEDELQMENRFERHDIKIG